MAKLERDYAQALYEASTTRSAADADSFAQSLIGHLKNTGRVKLLPLVLREFKNMQARNETQEVLLEVARVEDAQAAISGARDAGIEASKATVNPALIRGWRARSNGVLVDRSGKRALIDLYRNITTN